MSCKHEASAAARATPNELAANTSTRRAIVPAPRDPVTPARKRGGNTLLGLVYTWCWMWCSFVWAKSRVKTWLLIRRRTMFCFHRFLRLASSMQYLSLSPAAPSCDWNSSRYLQLFLNHITKWRGGFVTLQLVGRHVNKHVLSDYVCPALTILNSTWVTINTCSN